MSVHACEGGRVPGGFWVVEVDARVVGRRVDGGRVRGERCWGGGGHRSPPLSPTRALTSVQASTGSARGRGQRGGQHHHRSCSINSAPPPLESTTPAPARPPRRPTIPRQPHRPRTPPTAAAAAAPPPPPHPSRPAATASPRPRPEADRGPIPLAFAMPAAPAAMPAAAPAATPAATPAACRPHRPQP